MMRTRYGAVPLRESSSLKSQLMRHWAQVGVNLKWAERIQPPSLLAWPVSCHTLEGQLNFVDGAL